MDKVPMTGSTFTFPVPVIDTSPKNIINNKINMNWIKKIVQFFYILLHQLARH